MRANITDIITNDFREGDCYYVYAKDADNLYVETIGKNPVQKYKWEGDYLIVQNVNGHYDTSAPFRHTEDRNAGIKRPVEYKLIPIN